MSQIDRTLRTIGLGMLTTVPLWFGGEVFLPLLFWSAVVVVPALGALRNSPEDISFRLSPAAVPVKRG